MVGTPHGSASSTTSPTGSQATPDPSTYGQQGSALNTSTASSVATQTSGGPTCTKALTPSSHTSATPTTTSTTTSPTRQSATCTVTTPWRRTSPSSSTTLLARPTHRTIPERSGSRSTKANSTRDGTSCAKRHSPARSSWESSPQTLTSPNARQAFPRG